MKKVALNIFIFIIGVLAGKILFSERSIETKEVVKVVTKKIPVKSNDTAKEKLDQNKSVTIDKSSQRYFKAKDEKSIRIKNLFNTIPSYDPFSSSDINMDVINAYEDILRLSPENARALSEYSNYLIFIGQMKDAKPVLENCLEADPKDELCLGNYTMYDIHEGNHEAIDKSIDLCLERLPNNSKCLHNRGNSLMRKRDFKGAIKIFKTLLNLDSSNQKVTYYKKYIYSSIATCYGMEGDHINEKKYYALSCDEGSERACEKLKNM